MKAEQKSGRLSVKSTDDAEGRIRAVVSVFGNVDSYGDVMQKGAFKRTLEEWKSKDGNIPFLWDHQSRDPFAYIGEVEEAKETDEGLEVEAVFDMDNPTAAQVYRLLKSGRVSEYSFGFMVPVGGAKMTETEEDGYIRELHDVDLLEVSTTLVGANPATRTVEVRHAGDEITVTPVQAEEEKPESKADPVMDLKTIDTLLDALTNLRDTLDKTAEILTEQKSNLGEDKVADKGNEQTAAEESEKAGRDSNESKSADLAKAAVTVANLEAEIAILDIERILGK